MFPVRMFPVRMFPVRMFPRRMFPKVGATPPAIGTPTPVYTVEYRVDPQVAFWTLDTDPLWTNDADPFWKGIGAWVPWPGELKGLVHQQYQFRLTMNPGFALGKVTGLIANVDMPDVTEQLVNVAIGSSGTRLPITKSYQSIKAVQVTLIQDGGTATYAVVADKDLSGPLIKTFNISGVGVTGHVDAAIQGY